ncbi:hypothetical protein ACFYRC_00425 [Streptomyces sp. NPDC005279]
MAYARSPGKAMTTTPRSTTAKKHHAEEAETGPPGPGPFAVTVLVVPA